jgi:hypothetical protein
MRIRPEFGASAALVTIFKVGRTVAFACGAAMLSNCRLVEAGAQSAPSVERAYPTATDSLVHELRTRTPPEYGRPTRSNIRVLNDTSDVVPGLEYVWADYVPPQTADVFYRAVVARRANKVVVLRNPADWASAANWQASSTDEALRACREIVHLIFERQFPLVRPRVYTGPRSLANVRDRDSLQERLAPPLVQQRPDQSWLVQFWIVGVRDVTEFRCELTAETTSLTTLEVLKGYVTTPIF